MGGQVSFSRDRYEHLRNLLDGAGEGLRKEVSENLADFLRSAPRRLRQLEILHSLGMLAQLRSCAGALRESAEKIGAARVASACRELEGLPHCGPDTKGKLELVGDEYLAIEKSLLRICREMQVQV